MPIEIRELVIKATVENQNSSSNNSNTRQNNGNESSTTKEVVKELIDMIKNKNER